MSASPRTFAVVTGTGGRNDLHVAKLNEGGTLPSFAEAETLCGVQVETSYGIVSALASRATCPHCRAALQEARREAAGSSLRPKLDSDKVENLTRPVKAETAARKLAALARLEYRRGYFVTTDDLGPVGKRIAGLTAQYLNAGMIEEAGRGQYRVNLRALSADLTARLWADNPAGVQAAVEAVYAAEEGTPHLSELHPFETMADKLKGQADRVSAQLLQTSGHGKRDRLTAAILRYGIEAEALRASGDIGRMSDATGPALAAVIELHPSPITREAAARELAGRDAWESYGDARQSDCGDRKRLALAYLGMTPAADKAEEVPCEHCGGVNGYHACDAAERGEDDDPLSDLGDCLAEETGLDADEIQAAHVAGYDVRRLPATSEDGPLWAAIDPAGEVIEDGHAEAAGAWAVVLDSHKLAQLSEAERAAVESMRMDCPAPGDYGVTILDAAGRVLEIRYRTDDHDRNKDMTPEDRAQFLKWAAIDYAGGWQGASVIVSVEGVRYPVPAKEDAREADNASAVEALRAGAEALRVTGAPQSAAKLERMADKLAAIEARPISGGAPRPGECPACAAQNESGPWPAHLPGCPDGEDDPCDCGTVTGETGGYVTHAPGGHPDCTGLEDDMAELVSRCPACGEPADYCQGHGPSGDPAGAAILQAHDSGEHGDCHPAGCEDASTPLTACQRIAEARASQAARIAREAAGAAVVEIRQAWEVDKSHGAALVDFEEALRRAADIARDLPTAEAVAFLVRLPATLLEPLADFGPVEIEEAVRLARAQSGTLADIASDTLDLRETSGPPARQADSYEARARRLCDKLAALPAEILQEVPSSTLALVECWCNDDHPRVLREAVARHVSEAGRQYGYTVPAETLDARESGGTFPGWTWRDPMSPTRYGVLGLARLAPDAARTLRTLATLSYIRSWAVNFSDAGEFVSVGYDAEAVGGSPIVCGWIDPDGRTAPGIG